MKNKLHYKVLLTLLVFTLNLPLATQALAVSYSNQSLLEVNNSYSVKNNGLAQSLTLDPLRMTFQEVAGGFSQPVFVTNAGDGSNRMFVVELGGRIHIIKNGAVLATPFLDIQHLIKSSGGEQGLLTLAFHPNYAVNGNFYVAYTAPRIGDTTGSNLVLEKFSVSANNPDVANPNSGNILLSVSHPNYSNHNGGSLAFGQDRYLYWSTGDGGSGGDPYNNAQNLGSLLGKIIRIDVDSGSPYAIPASNPFYSSIDPNIKKEIWAYGLRNPWRISFDKLTHDLYIGDVGQSTLEEVDFQPNDSPGGENYGWRVMEGDICYNPPNGCNQSNKVLPVAEYDHSLGCSITGGYVYRGSNFPSLYGHYFYGDFCSGRVFSVHNNLPMAWDPPVELANSTFSISTFGEDEQKELYLADYGTGKLYNIRYQEPFNTISGNAGSAGVSLSYFDDITKTIVTDHNGNYTITVPSGWSGTVTPVRTGFPFIPTSRSYSNIQGNQTAQNYNNSWVGSVSITSNKNVVAVGRPHVGAEVASYDGFATAGAHTAYIPMLFRSAFGGTYNAAFYIQNVDAGTANITISYYDSTGALTCSFADTVTPQASKGYWLPGTCVPAGWIGGAVVTSDQNIVAIARPHIGAEVMTYNGFSSGSLTSYIPMLFRGAFGGTYDAAFYIQNVGTNTATVSIKYYDNTGALTCTAIDTIAALASKGYWLPSTCVHANWIGSTVITSDEPIVTVGRPHIGAQITTYNGFSAGSTTSYVPMLFKGAFGGTYNAAFYVQNLSGSTANITIKYYDLTGVLTCTATDTLSALASKGYWLPGTCVPTNWVGNAVITSDQDIVAVGRPHIGAQVTTYNGFPSGSLNSYLPMLFKDAFGGSYDSAFYVQNTEASVATVVTKFYDSTGVLTCSRSDTLPAFSTLNLWVPNLTCTP